MIRSAMVSLSLVPLVLGLGYQITSCYAACLLSYDTAAPLAQGDGLARLSLQGGSQGFATHLGSRLGLTHDREIFLRSGGCQRSDLWGGAFELGVTQRIVAHRNHKEASQAFVSGPIDVAFRISAISFMTDLNTGARTDLGFQPAILIAYPIALDAERQGSITLTAGLSVYNSDRRTIVRMTDPDEQTDLIEEERLSSSWRWSELVALSLSIDVMNQLPVALELRWQDRGFIAGASVGYQF